MPFVFSVDSVVVFVAALEKTSQLRNEDGLTLFEFQTVVASLESTRRQLIGGNGDPLDEWYVENVFRDVSSTRPDGTPFMTLSDFKKAVRTNVSFLNVLGIYPGAQDRHLSQAIRNVSKAPEMRDGSHNKQTMHLECSSLRSILSPRDHNQQLYELLPPHFCEQLFFQSPIMATNGSTSTESLLAKQQPTTSAAPLLVQQLHSGRTRAVVPSYDSTVALAKSAYSPDSTISVPSTYDLSTARTTQPSAGPPASFTVCKFC